MSKLFRKLSVIGLTVMMVATLVGAPAPVAYGQTTAELQAQIAQLLQQIQALQAQLATGQVGATAYNFTKDLTLGATGADVVALQDFLVAQNKGSAAQRLAGAFAAGVPKGHFGPLTRSAAAEYQAAVGISPAAGFFGPRTRAFVNSLAVTPPAVPGQPTPPAGAALAVSVAPDSPVAAHFPAGGSQVPFLRLTFTAGAQDATVTAMNVHRGGLSSDHDITNVYLMDGSGVLATNLGLAGGRANFFASAGLFTVRAGTSRVITVASDIGTVGAGKTFSWSVRAVDDITANVAVSGTFPFSGNTMTAIAVSNPALATLTLGQIGTGASVNAGTRDFLAGQFTLQSANSAVSVRSIRLTQSGTINASLDLANIRLMHGTTQVGATVGGLNPDGTVVFDLSGNPLQIASGAIANLTVLADVVGGVGRNFRFTIQRAHDVVATDMTYNVGAMVSATGGFPLSATQVFVSAGTLVVSRNVNSPVNFIASGAVNAPLAMFNFAAAGEAVRVTSVSYNIAWTLGGAENTAWNNLRLVDDQGAQIGTITSSGVATATPRVVTVSNLNYIIPANTTRVLSIRADVHSTYAGTLTGSLVSGTAEGFVSLSGITFGGSAGNALSAAATPFSAGLNNAVGAITTVSGASEVRIGSFVLSAGVAEGVNVSSVSLTTGAGVVGRYQNMIVRIGAVTLSPTQASLANSTVYTFTPSTPIAIAAGGQAVVDVFAGTIAGATSTAATVVSLSGAQGTGAGTGAVRTVTATTAGQLVTLNPSGVLTIGLASPAVLTQQTGMGVAGVRLGSFRFLADNNENIDVTSIVVRSTSTRAQDLTNLRLMSGTTQIGSTVVGVAGATTTTTFTLVTPFRVDMGQARVLDVLADINHLTGGAVSTDTATVGIDPVTYRGVDSQATAVTAPGTIHSGATFTIYRTTMTPSIGPALTTAPTLSNDAEVGRFNIRAGAASIGSTGDVIVNTVSLRNSGSLIQTSSSVVLRVFGSENPTLQLGTVTATSTNIYAVTLGTGWTVPAGTEPHLIVRADLGSAANLLTTAGADTYVISLTAAAWNDGTTAGIPINPIIPTPIHGQTSSF